MRSPQATCAGAARFAVLLPMLAISASCFTYVPVEPAAATPGEEVRVVLSHETVRGSSGLAALPDQSLEGKLVHAGEDSLGLSVWVGRAHRGTPFESVYETLTLPRRDVLRIEQRKLSKWRTGLTLAAAVVSIAVLAERVGLIENPNPPRDPTDPPSPPTGSVRPGSIGH